MPSLLHMPAPAAGVQQALLLEWSVEENAAFAASDVLAVIETDKAVIEVEAEADGVLHRRLVPAGQQVDVGTPIAVVGAAGDTAAEIDAILAQLGEAIAPRVEHDSDGPDGPESPAGREDPGGAETAAGAKHPGGAETAGGDENPSGDEAPGSDTRSGKALEPATARQVGAARQGGRIFASPIARRMAKDAGLALADLTATGPGGRIVRRDVQAAVTARQQTSPPAAPTRPSRPAGAASPDRTFTDIPHSRVRAAIAARLTHSQQSVPHFYLRAAPRVDALLALRSELNGAGGPKVSLNDLVVRAVARAHRAVPEMNVTFSDTAVRRYDYVDVAVAIATDDGLVTPVIRQADRLSITEIAAATTEVADRARNGRLRQQELEGGSITVTNLGMFGVEEFAAIINPPQSAILAVGAARREPVVAGEGLMAATVMHLVLSVDHRPLDGVVAARWLGALTDLLEHPARILA
jgi:pyruvate dehydrogenase E2 component (dihydrolipoamide acetyltransferase)